MEGERVQQQTLCIFLASACLRWTGFDCFLHCCSAIFYILVFLSKALRGCAYIKTLSLEKARKDLYLVFRSLLACLARIPFIFNLNIHEQIMNFKWRLVRRVELAASSASK